MKACEQANGLSVYQHGLDVANWYSALYAHLLGESTAYKFDIKDADLHKLQLLLPQAMKPAEARMYQIFHDCGKPRCLTIDEDGKRHFHNHAEESYQLYLKASGDVRTSRLIKHDMLCHTAKGEQLDELLKLDDAATLYITAWAEIHANADALFGGFDSESFKIKRKHLSRLGNKLVAKL
jgi:hypothetical protein